MCIIDEFGFKKEHKYSTLTSDLLLLREALLDSGGPVCGYVPSQAIQTLRQYERCYSRLNKKIVGCEQFIDMQLQEKQQEECLMNMVRICNESYVDPISL